MKLLSALCTCRGEAVACNQDAIADVLLKDPSVREALLIFIRIPPDSHHIEVDVCVCNLLVCVPSCGVVCHDEIVQAARLYLCVCVAIVC